MFLILIPLFALATKSFSQDSWKLVLNGKTLMTTSAEDAVKNVVTIKLSDLKKKNDFTVTYTAKPQKDKWERTMAIFTDKDDELFKQQGSKLKIKNATLLSLFKKSKTLKIYTWSLPTDPKLKASVRIRRIHLCTIILQ
jgi:hypothetical protein